MTAARDAEGFEELCPSASRASGDRGDGAIHGPARAPARPRSPAGARQRDAVDPSRGHSGLWLLRQAGGLALAITLVPAMTFAVPIAIAVAPIGMAPTFGESLAAMPRPVRWSPPSRQQASILRGPHATRPHPWPSTRSASEQARPTRPSHPRRRPTPQHRQRLSSCRRPFGLDVAGGTTPLKPAPGYARPWPPWPCRSLPPAQCPMPGRPRPARPRRRPSPRRRSSPRCSPRHRPAGRPGSRRRWRRRRVPARWPCRGRRQPSHVLPSPLRRLAPSPRRGDRRRQFGRHPGRDGAERLARQAGQGRPLRPQRRMPRRARCSRPSCTTPACRCWSSRTCARRSR